MKKANSQVYAYRWVVLGVLSILSLVIEIHWVNFAAIAREARLYYGVTALQIDFFSLIYMIVFLVMCIPASFIIDKYGIRIGTGIGAVLIVIFALMKGIFSDNYLLVCVAQTGLAIAQPFLTNAGTKVANHWFPMTERATAVGIASMSMFLGIMVALIATPLMLTQNAAGASQLDSMLMTYGIISAVSAILLLVLMKERPPTAPEIGEDEERYTPFKGISTVFKTRDMVIVLVVVFIALGTFNAITTCIDQISQLKSLNIEQAGMLGGVMLIAGLAGAIVLPILSDRLQKRKIFLLLGMIGMAPGLAGIIFASDYILLLGFSSLLGFFLLGAAPVLFQYSAEITFPAPESTVQGLIQYVGQISGVLFVYAMNQLSVTGVMYFFLALSIISIVLFSMIKESPRILISN